MMCENEFRVAGVGLCGTKGKVGSRGSNLIAALSVGKVRKGDVL